jgi:hypothetical protein
VRYFILELSKFLLFISLDQEKARRGRAFYHKDVLTTVPIFVFSGNPEVSEEVSKMIYFSFTGIT